MAKNFAFMVAAVVVGNFLSPYVVNVFTVKAA